MEAIAQIVVLLVASWQVIGWIAAMFHKKPETPILDAAEDATYFITNPEANVLADLADEKRRDEPKISAVIDGLLERHAGLHQDLVKRKLHARRLP